LASFAFKFVAQFVEVGCGQGQQTAPWPKERGGLGELTPADSNCGRRLLFWLPTTDCQAYFA